MDFMDNTISVSNTTPEDIAQAGIKAGAITIHQPQSALSAKNSI